MAIRKNYLLRDNDIRKFITDGYVQVNAGLPIDFHQNLCRNIETVFKEEGNPGNNILPRIPDLQRVFDQPAVRGALTSLLGPGYFMHPHRYCHLNKPGSSGQLWHKDDYIFDQNVRHARCRWLMAFYYPQDVNMEMGPTGILPGMQHHNQISDCDASKSTESELSLCGSAGTVSIVNFDSWHRATENVSAKNRYMLKFQFTRTQEPTAPAWENEIPNWKSATNETLPAVSESVWNWMTGGACGTAENNGMTIEKGLAKMDDPDERVRLQAAYCLGSKGKQAVEPLIERLCAISEEEALANIPRNPANPTGGNPSELPTAYGLSAIGPPAVEPLKKLLENDAWWLRATAADILGDIGVPAKSALPLLLRSLSDRDAWVRRNGSEALGIIGGFGTNDVSKIQEALRDEDERVRRNVAYALAKHPFQNKDLIADLVTLSVNDAGRYVRHYALAALSRVMTRKGHEALGEAMLASRWCPLTTRASAF